LFGLQCGDSLWVRDNLDFIGRGDGLFLVSQPNGAGLCVRIKLRWPLDSDPLPNGTGWFVRME